ncbi:GTP cyclohydrolase I, partial [Pseudomonas sp. RTC3]|nr:GTP cyclohydrolase I [Pseudomonas sp. RTC3]
MCIRDRSLPQHYREILVGLGENPDREGLLDTPKRAAKAMQYLSLIHI